MTTKQEIMIPIKIVYKGGYADQNRLDIYDGSRSLFGISKSLQITIRSLLNKKVNKKSISINGAKLYILPAKSGSYEQLIEIYINNKEIINTIGGGLLTNVVWEFIKIVYSNSVGLLKSDSISMSDALKNRLGTEAEPFFDEIGSAIQNPLMDAHRTIEAQGGTVSISNDNGPLITMDQSTLDYLKTRDENPEEEDVVGHVTRYNVISGNGRFYDVNEGRVIPFNPAPGFQKNPISKLLTWSINQEKNSLPSDIILRVKRIESARNITKKYIVTSCRSQSRNID